MNEDRELVLSDIEELVKLISDNLKDNDFVSMKENAEILVESLEELTEYTKEFDPYAQN